MRLFEPWNASGRYRFDSFDQFEMTVPVTCIVVSKRSSQYLHL